MASTSVTIRVDSDVKEAASRTAERFGLDLPSVTHAFYQQMIRENRIPLNLSDPEPNAESLEAIHEADELIAAGGPGYGSAADMFEAMGL
jgi:DNA-damage-inducible protein J